MSLAENVESRFGMYVTFYLIAVFGMIFCWEASIRSQAGNVLAGALVPYNIIHDVSIGIPVWLTPLTSLGLHAGFAHLISNALVLLAVGPEIEALCGSSRYLGFFLLCGVAGGLAQVCLEPGSHLPIIGASGAIAGLLGASVMRFPLHRSLFGVPIAVPILVWAVVQCLQSGVLYEPLVDMQYLPTAYAAHVGGFFFGMLTIGLFETVPAATNPR